MSLQNLINRCVAQHVQNVSGIATSVEIRRASGEVVALNTPLEVAVIQEADERGGLQSIEQAKMFVPNNSLDHPLTVGDRLCVDQNEPSYTFMYAGSRTSFGQEVTFQRYVSVAQGARSNVTVTQTGKPRGGR